MQLIKAQNIRTLALSETWISYSILQELGDPEGRRGRKILGGKFSGWLQGNNVFRASYKYEFPAVLKHEQEQCNLNSEKKKMNGGRWALSPTPTWRVIVNWLLIGDRKYFFFKGVAHRGEPYFIGRAHIQEHCGQHILHIVYDILRTTTTKRDKVFGE